MRGDVKNTDYAKYLTVKHIARFIARLAIGKDKNNPKSKVIRVIECQFYLDLWQSIETKGYKWNKLNNRERAELIEAEADEVESDKDADLH